MELKVMDYNMYYLATGFLSVRSFEQHVSLSSISKCKVYIR